jgi:hypothetical protein
MVDTSVVAISLNRDRLVWINEDLELVNYEFRDLACDGTVRTYAGISRRMDLWVICRR